jgi:hypothetical protein
VQLLIEWVERCLELMERHQLRELSLEIGELSVHLERAPTPSPTPTAALVTPAPAETPIRAALLYSHRVADDGHVLSGSLTQ